MPRVHLPLHSQPVSSTGREAVRGKSITVKIKTHGAIKESKLKIRSYIMKIPVNLTATDLGPGFCLKRWKLQ